MTMNFFSSLEQVDELRGLSKNDRRLVVMLYARTQPATPHSSNLDLAFLGAIIFAVFAGGLVGAFLFHNPDVGCFLGVTIGLFCVTCAFYFGNLYFTIPKFRQFLQTGPGKLMLGSIRTQHGAAPKAFGPSAKAMPEPHGDHRGDDDAPMSQNARLQAVKEAGYQVAQTAEAKELLEESLKETFRLSNVILQKSREASQAIRSLRLGKWRRLNREVFALQTEACSHHRRSYELLARIETKLDVASALVAKAERKSDP